MAVIKNVFTSSKMNLDVDERLLKKGEYRRALNIRVANSEGSDVGAIEKSLSNKQLTSLNLGNNVKTIGGISDEFKERMYWCVVSELGSFLIEYDYKNDKTEFVLKDTRIKQVLNFHKDYLITSIVIIEDTDNNNHFLVLTDNYNQPRCINIERAKLWDEGAFTEEDILLIKKPPIDAPKIILGYSDSDQENNIEEKFLRFGYRYKYIDNEYSAISPLSDVAFLPKTFEYDFYTSTNESMINSYNQVEIEFNTGSHLVKSVEVIYFECGKNIPYVIDTYSKEKKGYKDNTNYSIHFSNNKIYKNLPESQYFRLFDAVPLKAKSLETINNILVFGNYVENIDIVDELGNEIFIDLVLGVENINKTQGIPFSSCKTNREYEAAIVYLDLYGRQTTPLVSEKNTIAIGHKHIATQNQLTLDINHKAPVEAKYYRIFIKQNKIGFHTIVPNIFYESEGYVWIKLEANQKDVIEEGAYLNVKSDTRKLLEDIKRVKVIEVERKEKNFLETTDIKEFRQLPGLYMKIKPRGFSLDLEDLSRYYFNGFEWSTRGYYPVHHNVSHIQLPIFYGNSSLNDLSVSGNYTGGIDKNYIVVISSTSGDKDKFSVSIDNNNVIDEEEIIAGHIYNLDEGVNISFENDSGHVYDDKWVIRAKSSHPLNLDWSGYAMAVYQGIENDVISAGAIIDIIYDEYNNVHQRIHFHFIATKTYQNIEEWFYGDDIDKRFSEQGIHSNRVFFRRGKVGTHGVKDPERYIHIGEGQMNMLIVSLGYENSGVDSSVRIRFSIEIKQFQNRLIFETDPIEESSDIFYEIGRTYEIEDGFHKGYTNEDVSQNSTQKAIIKLPFFNCFSWGNGFESIKIKDEFNTNQLSIKTRPSTPIENYRKNHKIASLTYSKAYDQTLNYNGLNEFNLSELNYKDLDDKYGSIQRVMTFNNDLDVFQEDKVIKVFYGKTSVYNEDGSSSLSKSNLILGTIKPYAGEYGISNNPESLVAYGNYRYWTDEKRGVILRKGQSGIEIISKNGMKDWFRDYFRLNSNAKNIINFDPYYNQLTLTLNNKHTLTFDEQVKGFTSFHSFIPDWMLRLNNRFFSIKDGQLFIHNDETQGYNIYYGKQYNSEITTILNDQHGFDKIFKTLILESTNTWSAHLETNISEGHIKGSEFFQRESRWFAYMPKNENDLNYHASVQGLGRPTIISGDEIGFVEVSSTVSVGDEIYQIVDDKQYYLGALIEKKSDRLKLNLDHAKGVPSISAFFIAKKNSRIEGGDIRGYFLKIKLIDTTNEPNELFAVNSEVVKSF
ncbi:hypothetical protein [Tenacibaculum sp. 190524A02b]|uniref:hypothetical protein n=1 Tax=Tenacibaculum vairaonense TaxID=3137860 RepID=UPI0031FB9A41